MSRGKLNWSHLRSDKQRTEVNEDTKDNQSEGNIVTSLSSIRVLQEKIQTDTNQSVNLELSNYYFRNQLIDCFFS